MKQCVLIAPTGDVRLFGIRFQSHGAFPFFRFDLSELANRIVPLDEVWGRSVSAIEDRLAAANGFDAQIAVAESELTRRLVSGASIDLRLNNAINAIVSGSGRLRVAEIAKDAGISERSLERAFNRRIGVSPKTFSRIVRFQRVLRSTETFPRPSILDTAFEFGYYDQSHLINDFRQFVGTSPEAFFERSRSLTGHFISGE